MIDTMGFKVLGIAVAFATSSGSSAISYVSKYNECTSLILFMYSANSLRFEVFPSPERTLQKLAFFTAPPIPSRSPFPGWVSF